MSGSTLQTPARTSTSVRRQGTNARLAEATRMAHRAQRRQLVLEGAKGAWPKVALAMAILAAVGSLGWWLHKAAFEPRWSGLETVRVRYDGRVGPQEVVALAKIRPGTSLLSLDLDALRGRIAAHPWVAKVEVSRHWPHGILVEIDERVPVARLADGNWISRDGTVLPARGVERLPLLVPLAVRSGPVDSVARAEVLEAMAGLRQAGFTEMRASALRGGGLRLDMGSGQPAALVGATTWKVGMARWKALREEVGDLWSTLSEIDLRHGSCAALRRAEGGT